MNGYATREELRRHAIERESIRSDEESANRMHWLAQVLVMAIGLPVAVFLAVTVADSLTGLHVVAEVLARAGK